MKERKNFEREKDEIKRKTKKDFRRWSKSGKNKTKQNYLNKLNLRLLEKHEKIFIKTKTKWNKTGNRVKKANKNYNEKIFFKFLVRRCLFYEFPSVNSICFNIQRIIKQKTVWNEKLFFLLWKVGFP